MKKKLKKFLLISGMTLAVFLVLVAGSLSIVYFHKSLTRSFLERFVTQKTGAQFQIADLDYGFFPLRIRAESVKYSQKIGGMEVVVSLSGLSLEGEIGRLLRKERPFLHQIEVKGADLRVEIREVEEEIKIDFQKYLLSLRQFLSYLDRLELKDFSLKYTLLSESLQLEGSRLSLSRSGLDGGYDYSLSSEKAGVLSKARSFGLESSLHAQGTVLLTDGPSIDGEFSFAALRIDFNGEKFSLLRMAVRMKGEFALEEKIFSFSPLEMSIPGIGEVSGSFRVDSGKGLSVRSTSRFRLEDLDKASGFVKPFLGPYLPARFKDFALEGALKLEGDCRFEMDPSHPGGEMEGRFKLLSERLRLSTPEFSIQHGLSGEFEIKGVFQDLALSGSLELRQGRLFHEQLNVQDFSFGLSLAATRSLVHEARINGDLKGLSLAAGDRSIDVDQLRLEGKVGFDLSQKSMEVKNLELTVNQLPPFQVDSRLDLKAGGEKDLRLFIREMDSSALMSVLAPFVPQAIANLEPVGRFSLDLKARESPKDGGGWQVSTHLQLSRWSFNNPSFTIAGEDLYPELVLEGAYHPLKQRLDFFASFHLHRGEALWDKYYVDWSQSPVQMNASGVFDISARKIDSLNLEAQFPPVGKLQVRGEMSMPEPRLLDLEVVAPGIDLGSLFSFLNQGYGSRESSMELKGRAQSRVRLQQRNGSLSAEFLFRVGEASLKSKDEKLKVEGIELEIPLFLETPLKESREEKTPFLEKGFLEIKEFNTPLLSVSPLRLNFRSAKNRFLVEPFTVEMFGGKAALGESFFFIGSKPDDIHGLLSFSLSGVDISRFPLQSDEFRLNGRLKADFSRMEISPGLLSTEGDVRLEMFDTEIIIENFSVSRPFSRDTTISGDVRFDDLNLEKLTDAIPFGRVTGVLRGEIKGLAFSYGQPEGFLMLLESVKKKGVPQKFSLGAVNDLSILSSGEGSSLSPNKGFTRFISEFGYEQIGIFCSLKNDVFTMRGTIREGGVEFLVKKSWLFGISVVNKKPRSKINFKDMMNRLKRIGQSRGPAIQK